MKIAETLFWKSALIALIFNLFSSINVVQAGQIFGEKIIVDYDYDGFGQRITLLVQFESSLSSVEVIQIQFPVNLGPYNQVFSSIYEQKNNLQLAGNVMADTTSKNNYYIFAYKADLKANNSYRIEITFINQIPNDKVYVDPISMMTMSKIGANAIIYDQNLSLFYLYVAPAIPNETLIVGIQLDSKPQEEYITDPGIIFSAFIDITPSISNSQGGYYYVYIDVGPNVIGSKKGADFKFVGKCQSVENKCDSRQNDPNCQEIKQVQSTCTINNQSGMIEFLQNDPIVAQKPIRIIVEIQNCLFTSQRDIKVYSASINDKRPMEKGRKAIALRVSEVQIQRKKIQYLWGVDENESIFSPYKLFKSKASPLAGPLNSIQVYFSIPTLVPEGSDLTVSLETGADGCLEHSIITNLPVQTDKKKVSCYFEKPFIKCKNIGAFQDASIEYFIAAKIFFSSTATNPTNFAGIKITSIVKDDKGVVIPDNIYLFKEALGMQVTLQQNTEYLDTAQWHKKDLWSFGTTQIISTPDDGTLSGVPNGINAILKGSQNTVGIVPNLESDQQLIFFLKVAQSELGSADGKYYRMSVLYNPDVVKYKTDYENKGIDFAAYSNTKGKWELDKFACYTPVVATAKQCVWYNKPQLQANRIDFTYNTLISKPYAFIRFECGLKTAGVARSTCDNFQGHGTSDSSAGAFSMRNVYFDSKFQSSIYPDDKLLDFIITFEEKLYTDPDTVYTTVSTQLINAYTIQNYRLSNIKLSYVNLYSNAAGIGSNNGLYVPTMLRIGGSILRSESYDLDKIHIFLDENVDATAFLENNSVDKSDHSIGCSLATCEYFANAGASVATDTWFNQKKIEITNLPNIQNEFNILIPITNTANTLPSRVVIAFTNSQHSTFGLGGLDQVLNVFRVAGLPVNGKLETPILPINAIANNVAVMSDYVAEYKEAGITNKYEMDLTKVGVQSTIDETELIGDGSVFVISNPTDAQMYGGGLTITSFTQNIFSISDIQFKVPPSSGAQKCTSFQYKINTADPAIPERNNQYNYVVFCPIDDNSYKIDATQTDPTAYRIIIKDPNFPGFFVDKYQLSTVLTYAFSNNKGSLISYKKETKQVTNVVGQPIGKPWQCTTNTVTVPHPSSKGRQKIEFVIPWNDSDIKIDNSIMNGYKSLLIRATFTSLSDIAFVTNGADVLCSNSQFNCLGKIVGSAVEFTLSPIDLTQVYTIERSLNIVITTFAVITAPTAVKYSIDILIPTKKGTDYLVYGDTYDNVIYQQCDQVDFKVDAAQYAEVIEVSDLAFEIINVESRSTLSFNFRSVSPRQEFYITSQYIITLGFLTSVENRNLLTQNNLSCYIMERDYTTANSAFTISHKWNSLQITNFDTITLIPHSFIPNPQNYQFKLICIGGQTTDGLTNAAVDLSVLWKDGADDLQKTTTPIKLTGLGYTLPAKKAFDVNGQPTIVTRLFASPGMEAHYKLKVYSASALTVQSRIYIDFGIGFSPRINKNGRAECYITNSPEFDTQEERQTLTLCEIINNRRLKVYANDLVSSVFYIDILGVSMPQKLPINGVARPVHWIGIDVDDDLTNGIAEQGTFLDTFPSQTDFTAMTCSNVYTNQNIIRRAHSITFTIQTQRANILDTNTFYVDFPYQYDSIKKGDIITCVFRRLDLTTYPTTASSYKTSPNLVKKCDFISLTRLRVILNKKDDQTLPTTKETYTLLVQNIVSPSQVVSGLRFNIFASKNTDLNSIFLIASDYGASEISYVAEKEKTDLQWSSLQYQKAQQNVIKTTRDYLNSYYSTIKYFKAYIGFYNCDIQLLPKSSTETKFKNTFSYTFASYTNNFYFDNTSKSIQTAMTGTSASQFKLTAQSTTSPGIFTLHPPKSDGDTLQQYMDLPPLNLVVSTDRCQVNDVSGIVEYQIPEDGQSLPIIFDFTNCYPAESIKYTPSNDLADPTQLIVDADTYQDTIDGTKGDWQTNNRMSMIFKPKTSGLIPAGTVIKVTFTLGGFNLLSYIEPVAIQLKMIAPVGAGAAPIASDINIISQSANTITLQFSCDQPSIVLYQVGLEDKTAPEYKAIIKKLTSSRDFFVDTSDFDYYKQYGRLVIPTAGGTVQKTISDLQSSAAYKVYYYCVNQQPKESTVKTSAFQIVSNGGYLLKVILYFTDQITYNQNQDIACALSQVFSLNYQRVVNEQNVYCGGSYPYFIKDVTAKYKKTRSTNNLYSYSYYILQDKTLNQDLVNLSIKEIIQYRTFNETLLSRTQNPQLFPILQDPETEDILTQFKSSASLDVSTIDTSFAKLSVTLIGQKGYIYIGIMAGSQNLTFKNFLELKSFQSLLYFWSGYVPRDIEQSVTFTNLQPGTTYTIFYAATNDNPSIQALSTGVLSKQFTTKSIQIVVEVSSRRLLFSILLIALSLLL